MLSRCFDHTGYDLQPTLQGASASLVINKDCTDQMGQSLGPISQPSERLIDQHRFIVLYGQYCSVINQRSEQTLDQVLLEQNPKYHGCGGQETLTNSAFFCPLFIPCLHSFPPSTSCSIYLSYLDINLKHYQYTHWCAS